MKDIAMKSAVTRVLILFAAFITLARPALVHAATPASGEGKLDRTLTVIADAVANNRADALMAEAITREMFRRNTPFDARWNAAAQVQVYLHYDRGGLTLDLDELKSLGATDILVSQQLGVVQAWVPATALTEAANLSGVLRVSVPRYAVAKNVVPLGPRYLAGSVDTQGDGILGASQFRAQTGFTGRGSVVGVISNGDTNASKDASTGDLPSNIWNDPNDTGSFKSSGDEGTAMLEIVYDLAPGVDKLGFCGPQTEADFLTCLDDFATNLNPTVIVDDLGFPGGPMFTDGSFAQGVQSFANAHTGVRLVTAAGNDGNGFWSGPWNNAPVTTSFTLFTPNGNVSYTQALNFGTAGSPNPQLNFIVQGTSQITGGDSANYQVQWNDPWDDSPTATTPNINDDYDVVLFDSSNHVIAYNQGTSICSPPVPASPANNIYCTVQNPGGVTASQNSPGPQPIQGSFWTNSAAAPATVHLEVFLNPNSPNTPGNNIKILVYSQHAFPVSVNPATLGGIYGHAALAYPTEITVGAVPASPPGSPESCAGANTNQIEPYSSTGPVVLGTTSGQTPETRMKPDLVGPDGISTTGVGGFGEPFCGTSAAAPHIAGLLALLGPAYPSQAPYNLLTKYAATPDGSAAPNGVFGNGLPSLARMLSAGAFPPPTASISSPSATSSIAIGSKLAFNGTCNANGASSVPTADWNFGSGSGIADSSQTTTTATFSKAGAYTVTLSCTDSLGSNSASVTVNVTAPSSSGGGGDLGLGELAGLFAALAISRRRRPRR